MPSVTQPFLFADDTSIFYSNSDPNKLQSILNVKLPYFDVWLKCNKLSVNLIKTNYIIFKSRQTKLSYNFTLFFGNQSLNQANLTKFLGLRHHISLICKQISKSVGIIFRSRFYSKTKLTLYDVLIYPYITYCNSTWSSTYVFNLNRIFYLQKGCASHS